MKNVFFIVLLSLASGFGGAYLFHKTADVPAAGLPLYEKQAVSRVNFSEKQLSSSSDMISASKKSTPGVVYIKTLSNVQQKSYWDDWFAWDIFGRRGQVSSSGSGVIISSDGYIVTNNHVVEKASSIEVVLNNSRYSFKAEIIGTDASTDLALIKIDASKLPAIPLGNSDRVEIGEWVLAVGNPFNLTSTVTAGIVSAKGRNINVVNNSFPIESFIQTDAAINPGNSGGALVNLNGELIGINTAIASNTGAYNGYGFAIPSNIVAKVVKDLKEYGEVQRAFLGMDVVDITADILKKTGDLENGVYVGYVAPDGPARAAKIQEGDVIFKVNGTEVNSKASFDEQVAYHCPGDKLTLTLSSGKQVQLTLVNREGTTEKLRRVVISSPVLGADFEKVSKVEKDRYNISSGIRVSNIRNGTIQRMNIPEGFIFVKINNNSYDNASEMIRDLEQIRGRIIVEGILPNGSRQVLSYYYY
jgi:serine protease Do